MQPARCLDRKTVGNLFIFDEPRPECISMMSRFCLQLFQRLIDAGHSLVVIEHNLEVIKCAAGLIDLGPEPAMKAARFGRETGAGSKVERS